MNVQPRDAGAGQCVVADARVVAGSGGGPDKTLLLSPRYLADAGYKMLCVYLRSPKDEAFATLRTRAAEFQTPLVEINDTGPLDWRVVPALATLCRRERVRIWHGHDYKTNLLGLLLNRCWPMRLVTTVHGWVQHTTRTVAYYLLDRWSLRHYEKVFCVSDDLLRTCRAAGVPRQKLVLLENGIDTQLFQRRSAVADAKRRLGIRPECKLVGAVGRLSAEKGFDLLIHALARIAAAMPAVQLVIIGEGEERQRLEEVAIACGTGHAVRFAGYQSDVRAWFEAMDVFALSSLREGLPNVVLEAMAMETPVVATDVGGVRRLVQDERTGRLVPAGDAAALAAALTGMLAGPDGAQTLAANARQAVAASWSFAARMAKLRDHYDQLLRA
jgi:glycosyltransferase involved in cell wall biosynthesis